VRCFAFRRRLLHIACGKFVARNCISIPCSRFGKKCLRVLPRLHRPKNSTLHASANQRRCVHKCDMALKGHLMQALLTVDQLAECLRKSVASIRSDATRNPQSLPPVCRLPGTKRLLWRVEDVENWLGAHVTASATTAEAVATPAWPAMPRRGRPTKAEQVARQRRESYPATLNPTSRSAR
jgi:hypothetical protein